MQCAYAFAKIVSQSQSANIFDDVQVGNAFVVLQVQIRLSFVKCISLKPIWREYAKEKLENDKCNAHMRLLKLFHKIKVQTHLTMSKCECVCRFASANTFVICQMHKSKINLGEICQSEIENDKCNVHMRLLKPFRKVKVKTYLTIFEYECVCGFVSANRFIICQTLKSKINSTGM